MHASARELVLCRERGGQQQAVILPRWRDPDGLLEQRRGARKVGTACQFGSSERDQRRHRMRIEIRCLRKHGPGAPERICTGVTILVLVPFRQEGAAERRLERGLIGIERHGAFEQRQRFIEMSRLELDASESVSGARRFRARLDEPPEVRSCLVDSIRTREQIRKIGTRGDSRRRRQNSEGRRQAALTRIVERLDARLPIG